MTPLLHAAKANVMPEPNQSRNTEDVEEGEDEHVVAEQSLIPNLEDLALQSEAGDGESTIGSPDEANSVLNIILECDIRAASYADAEGRLPLAHAIATGKSWNGGVRQLIAACPRALESRDMLTRFHMFQLAAINCREMDTIYSMVRGLPELLTFNEERHQAKSAGEDDDEEACFATATNKKRRG